MVVRPFIQYIYSKNIKLRIGILIWWLYIWNVCRYGWS